MSNPSQEVFTTYKIRESRTLAITPPGWKETQKHLDLRIPL